MKNRSFYRQCYLDTGGWLPMNPLSQAIRIGDFCHIHNGVLEQVGNIANINVLDDVLLSPPMICDELWSFSEGVKSVSVQRTEDKTYQTLQLSDVGSYAFFLKEPKATYILNWQEIKDNLILKLTQSNYGFREVYVVTAVSTGSNWSGVIAGQSEAELRVSASCRLNSSKWYELLKDESATAESFENLEYFEKHLEMPCFFFQAKKLKLSEAKKESIFVSLVKDDRQSRRKHIQSNLLSLVPGNEITLHNCLDFFEWQDINLDDVERLC